ncbi:MAG TPA: AMP-binding protein [Myxococcota bacterium]|nr:AMP-binding protein [Myxococcota bacterium]
MRPDPGPEANVGSWLALHASTRPEHTALVVERTGERISYRELEARVRRTAAALRELGLAPGDRIALALPSEPLYLELYFAAALLGAISIPLNTRLTAAELGFQLDDAEPRLAIRPADSHLPARTGTRALSPEELRRQVAASADFPERPPAPGGESPQTILYTSGTTGQPKGALLPHRKTYWNTRNAELYFELDSSSVAVCPIPLFHSFGLKILSVPALYCGATLVLVERFDPLGLQDCVASHRATLLGAVPVMYARMLEAGLAAKKLESLRFAFSAGAPIAAETIERYFAQGVCLKQGYGQTETSILCCLDAADARRKAGSVGKPVPFGEIRIADESGRVVAPGQNGEVQVRGPIVMLGYWRRPEETAASRVGGWHRTGDLGVVDAEGFVTLVGRSKELYISGGENVYPAEVERVLGQHPDVSEVAVVGVPDARWGESGRAYVVPARAPFDPDELLAWAGQRLARYKLPREVVLVKELPRTASGKVQKHVLVAQR